MPRRHIQLIFLKRAHAPPRADTDAEARRRRTPLYLSCQLYNVKRQRRNSAANPRCIDH